MTRTTTTLDIEAGPANSAPVEHSTVGRSYMLHCRCGADVRIYTMRWGMTACPECAAPIDNPHEALSTLLDAFERGDGWAGSRLDVARIARSLGATGGAR